MDTRRHQLPSLGELGRDLISVTTRQRWSAIASPFLAVIAYGIFAWLGWWIPAIGAVAVYTFFSYGSTCHDLVHGNLGLSHRTSMILLSIIEMLGLRSGHAYRVVHLHHHKVFPRHDDVEATAAHGSRLNAILAGPMSQVRSWWWALLHSPNDRGWIAFEGAMSVAIMFAAIALYPITAAPAVYVLLVIAGSWTFPILTVYLPHDPHGLDELQQTRRIRGKFAHWIFLGHYYHLEHHLYPKVPHHNWSVLAKRLDHYLDRAEVPTIVWGF